MIKKVSRIVNAPFNRSNDKGEDSSDCEQSEVIGPRENILRRRDSVMIVLTNDRLRREFPDKSISPTLIFDSPTIESIAHTLVESDTEVDGHPSSEIIGGEGAHKPGWVSNWCDATLRPFTQLGLNVDGDTCPCAGAALYEIETSTNKCFRSTDGMECVLVPGSTVQIGTDTSCEWSLSNEGPRHQVELSSFFMDIEPVSVCAYARFLNNTKPPNEVLQDWCLLLEGDERECHLPLCCNNNVWQIRPGVAPNWPMILVSWYGANAYSLWANDHDWREYRNASQSLLPSESQWEYAARGPDAVKFPWGEAPPSPALLNVCWDMNAHDPSSSTAMTLTDLPLAPVNMQLGVSPLGLRHMAGNVWQWCRDTYDANFYSSAAACQQDAWNCQTHGPKSERGGSWVGPPELARSSYRRGRSAEAKGRCLGFRCVGLVPEASTPVSA